MEQAAINFARTQADGLDNIAPTSLQGKAAWQYAQSDNFFSSEEQAAVLRRELEPYHAQLETRLGQIGWGPDHLAKLPTIQDALFSGRQTVPLEISLGQGLKMYGCLRIVMTDEGPDIRITPLQQALTIPEIIGGVRLSPIEQQQLYREGALPRPLLVPKNGAFVPTFLRVDTQTNTVELWRVKPEQLPTKLMGIDLTKDQQLQLVSGHAVRLTGLVDRQGEPFDATVTISAARQQLQFTNINRLDMAVKPERRFTQQIAHNNEGAKTDQACSQEVAIGAPAINNSQRETVEKLLEGKQELQPSGNKLKVH
ncbi:DUF3945 domain-containing protein [Spirosoma gilvum]